MLSLVTGGGSFVHLAEGGMWIEGGNTFPTGAIIFDSPCRSGERLDQKGDCQNINACSLVPCPGNSSCVDLLPPAPGNGDGRTCMCNQGYVMVDDACEDIDACTNNRCPDWAMICTDLPAPAVDNAAGRTCTCPSGMTLEKPRCREINACQYFPCINARCFDEIRGLNSTQGRVCVCNSGTIADGDTEVNLV